MRRFWAGSLAVVCAFVFAAGALGLDASQLVGAWVRTGPADMAAIEFQKNAKAQLYFGGPNEATEADYSIAQDGRLTLGMGGQNMFFQPTISGDQLTLRSPDMNSTSSYRRLKSGETIAAALAAVAGSEKRNLVMRNAAIPTLLARQDLVIVNDGGKGAPPAGSLQLSQMADGYAGRVYYQGTPLRVENVTVQIRNPQSDSPAVVFTMIPVGGNQSNREQVTFHSNGTAPNITLISHVSFNGVFDASSNNIVTIKPDAALHGQILDGVKAESARLNALRTPVIAMLKDYVVLKGTSAGLYPNQKGFVDQFVLSRSAPNGVWMGQGQITDRTTGQTKITPAIASVALMNGKPVVQILTQEKAYLYSNIDAAGGKLGGVWHLQNNPMGKPAEASIVQALDTTGRDKLFAARKAALQHMGSGLVYHTLIRDKFNDDQRAPSPVAATISVAADGAISGAAEYPQQGCTMTLAGKVTDTPLGPQLSIHYAGGKSNPGAWHDVQPFMDAVKNETWTLSPIGNASDLMHLAGFAVVRPAPGAMPLGIELTPYTDKDRAAIVEAFNAGIKFKVTTPPGPGADTILTFNADPKAPGAVAGLIASGGTHLGSYPNTALNGTFTENGHWLELTCKLTRPGQQPVYAFTMVATPMDSGLYLSGFTYNMSQTRVAGSQAWDAVQFK